MTVARARELAAIGLEWVRVGGLTHSARVIDFSLDLIPEQEREAISLRGLIRPQAGSSEY